VSACRFTALCSDTLSCRAYGLAGLVRAFLQVRAHKQIDSWQTDKRNEETNEMRAERLTHDRNLHREPKSHASLWQSLAIGAAAGLAGTIAMTQFQNAWSSLSQKLKAEDDQKSGSKKQSEEPATVKVAQSISKAVTGGPISDQRKSIAGQIIHYGFGTAIGAVYGVLSDIEPRVTAWSGLPFGTAVWVSADNIAVPALGFSKPPTKAPLKSHAYALTSHIVYGLSTDLARRGFRRLL
jgi:putative membrane protein